MTLSLTTRLGMLLRGVPVRRAAAALAAVAHHNIALTRLDIEAHLLAGGDPLRVIAATLAARERGILFDKTVLLEADLLGVDPLVALATPNDLPPHQRPVTVLRAQAATDPTAATELARQLIVAYNGRPRSARDVPGIGILGRLLAGAEIEASLQRGEAHLASQLAQVLPLLPTEARRALPALSQDV